MFSISGNLLKVLEDPKQRDKTFSFDLCLYGNTLVVPQAWSNISVLMYELVTDE